MNQGQCGYFNYDLYDLKPNEFGRRRYDYSHITDISNTGINARTGFSKRVESSKDIHNLPLPLDYKKLPDFTKFITGKQTHSILTNDNKCSLFITIITILGFILLIVFFIVQFLKFKSIS